jgi:hypothetical protein
MRPATRACSLPVISIILSGLLTLTAHAGTPFTAVLTQHNDNARTGDNLAETSLTVTNVNTNTFGLLYSRPVDDEIYAQPLIMTNVTIPSVGVRNLLIIATVNDTVYAYDADDPSVVAPYWTNSFIQPPNVVAVSDADLNAIGTCGGDYQDFDNRMGIVGTPVIDPASGTIYVVARTREISGGQTNFFQRLHALDPTTGQDLGNSPVIIAPTYPGIGDGSDGTNITFDPIRQNQRPALLLLNGTVYVSWSSHCDNGPYHGWVLGYNAATLQQTVTFMNTPNGSQGGIWMSGQGPSADTNGNILLSCGNGTVDTNNGNYGESLLKLTNDNSGTLRVASYFIPRNWSPLDNNDVDLGCAGMLLVPGTPLAVSASKGGMVYVVKRDSMGGTNRSTSTNPIPFQSWSLGKREIHSSPVSWTCTNGTFMYIWGASGDRMRQYKLAASGKFKTSAFAVSDKTSGWPGGMLSVSANGTNSGTGIIWAVTTTSYPFGALRAYNAQKVTHELWGSDMLPGDAMGTFAKYVPPTIANGKVYVATFDNRVQVYGLH